MPSAAEGKSPYRHSRPTEPLLPARRTLMLIAAAGYGLFGAIMTAAFIVPGWLDPTLAGTPMLSRALLHIGLATLVSAAIGALSAVAYQDKTAQQNARRRPTHSE